MKPTQRDVLPEEVEKRFNERFPININGDSKNYHEIFEWKQFLAEELTTACEEAFNLAIREVVDYLDILELRQPEDLKSDNWRNWKYIRNSIVDKYKLTSQGAA